MAANGVVVTLANEHTPNIGDLFAGKGFFVTQRVPQRSNFLERIRANGGRIVRLEPQADYIIADHLRPDCPPGSLSYTFIEAAIRAGAIPDPNRHLAGFTRNAPAAIRAIGSTIVKAKATRTPFTPQDDRDVWTWVQNCQRQGGSVKGYEIYKQLEKINDRHTFQSWRDRYLKKLVNNPPQGVALPAGNGAAQNPPSTALMAQPAMDGAADAGENGANGDGDQESEPVEEPDTEDPPERSGAADYKFLMENIEDILNVPEEDHHVMWDQLAEEESTSHRTAEQWKVLYEDEVLPAYNRKKKAEMRTKASPLKRRAPRPSTPEPPSKPYEEMTTPEQVAALKAKAAKDAQTSPSVTQKRKRETATPRRNTNGRKRAKAGRSDIFANDEQAAVQDTSTSAHLPEYTGPSTNPQNVISLHRDRENGNDKGEDSPMNEGGQDQTEAGAEAIRGTLPPHGLQLTAENLASHHEEQTMKTVTRGKDLRENDEHLDDYATYLRKLVDGHVIERTQKAQAEANADAANEPESELESDRELSPEPNVLQQRANGDLQLDMDWSAVDPEIQGTASNLVEQGADAANARSTQLNANDGNIQIDLALAEPEGGFNFSSQEDKQLPGQFQWESQDQFQIDQIRAYNKATTAEGLDTQAIYDAGAQEPDFSLPLPDSYQEESEPNLPTDPVANSMPSQQPISKPTITSRKQQSFLTSSKNPAQPEPDFQKSQEPESIASFMARLTARGHDPEQLRNALYVTSCNTEFAELVAFADRMYIKRPDHPEIWSEEDDRKLAMTDAEVIKALVAKKGWEEYEARVEFLRDFHG